MKVVLLSQQFRDGEGVSEYCKNIAEHLVENGHDVSIVAFEDGSYYSIDERVDVHRVPLNFSGDNIYNWAMMLNNEIKGRVSDMMEGSEVDLIHVNDWVTVPGGVTLSKHLETPLVVTIHSTENERGFEGDHAGLISELEWKGGFAADKVLATKHDTRNSLLFDLDIPEEKLEVIDPYEEGWEQRVLRNYEELVKHKKEVLT